MTQAVTIKDFRTNGFEFTKSGRNIHATVEIVIDEELLKRDVSAAILKAINDDQIWLKTGSDTS